MHKYTLSYLAITIYVFIFAAPVLSQSYSSIEKRIANLGLIEENDRHDSLRAIIDDFVSYDIPFEQEQYKKIMGMSSKWNDKRCYIVSLIGYANYDRQNTFRYLDIAYKLAVKNNYKELTGEVLYVKAMLYKEFGMYDSLTVNLIKAINLYEELGLKEKKVGLMHSSADLFYSVGLLDKAEKQYKTILEQKGDEVVWNAWRHKVIINDLALIEMERGNYNKALEYLNQSLKLNYEEKQTQRILISIGYITQLMARCYYHLGNIETAGQFYYKSLAICSAQKMNPELVHLYNLKAQMLLDEGKLDSSLAYCKKSGEIISTEGGSSTGMLNCYNLFSQVYEKTGNYKEAYIFKDKYSSLNDSLLNKSNTVANMQLLAENEFNKISSNLVLVRRTNIFLLVTVVIALLLILAFVVVFIKLNKAHKVLLEKDRELTELMRMVTHNLKTPIGVIRNANEFLLEEDLENETVKEMATLIDESSAHMLESVKQLLLSSQIEDGLFVLNKSHFDLVEVMNEVIDDHEMLLKNKNQQLERIIPKDKKVILNADRDKIAEAANNYLSNAIKYSPYNSVITTKVEVRRNYAFVSVIDHGPGLNRRDIELAFGKFIKLTPRPTGNENSTGLGLSIVKKIIELHKGKVGINSELNKGSEFYFGIPIYNMENVQPG